MGDVQLKLVIQWMAASVAGLPVLVYYTAGHEMLTKVRIYYLQRGINYDFRNLFRIQIGELCPRLRIL